jgi:hypothetical protein
MHILMIPGIIFHFGDELDETERFQFGIEIQNSSDLMIYDLLIW